MVGTFYEDGTVFPLPQIPKTSQVRDWGATAFGLGALSLLRPGVVSAHLRCPVASYLPSAPPKLPGLAFVAILSKYIGTQ